jgi:hypothetical protein
MQFILQTYIPGKTSYNSALQVLRESGARVYLVEGNQFDIQDVLISARNESMLTSEYAFVISNEYNHDLVLATNVDVSSTKEPPNLDGIFQVQTYLPDNALIKEYAAEWDKLVKTTERGDKTCSTYEVGQVASKGTVGCFKNSNHWSGVIPRTYRHLNNRVPELPPTIYDSIQCLDSIARVFDYNTRNGMTTVQAIADRRTAEGDEATLIQLYDKNISMLVNNAASPDGYLSNHLLFSWNGEFKVDASGDSMKLINIINYQTDSKLGISLPVKVGLWSPKTSKISLNGNYYFIGGKTTAPQQDKHKVPINFAVRYGFAGAVAICAAITIGLVVYMYLNRTFRVIQASSPTFLAIVALGSIISYGGTFVSIWEPTVLYCSLYPWFKYIGFALVFGALLIKTYRIQVIFTSKSKSQKNAPIKDGSLLVRLFLYVSSWIVLLTIYSAYSPIRPYVSERITLVDDGSFFSKTIGIYITLKVL